MKFRYVKRKNIVILLGFLQGFAVTTYAKTEIDVCPVMSSHPDISYQDNTPTDRNAADPDQWLKALSTDLVVKEFFNRPPQLFNFLSIVYTNFDGMLNDFMAKKGLDKGDAIFIFKGGNMLRMLAHRTFDLVTPEARSVLQEKYEQFFKRSDADFSILVNPAKVKEKGLDYEKTMTELVNLTYKKLNDIRSEMETNAPKYFGFLQFSSDYRSKVLAEYLAKAKETPDLKDPNNPNWNGAEILQLQFLNNQADNTLKHCRFEGGIDDSRAFTDKSEKQVVVKVLDKQKRWMRNTINRSLKFYADDTKTNLVNFDLVRLKILFNLIYKKDGQIKVAYAPGEGIDVSFPLEPDFRTQEMYKHLDTNFARYKLQFKDTGEELNFVSESPEGLSADLREILFGQVSRPWESAKYEKRVYRIFFIGIMEMLAEYGVGSNAVADYVQGLNTNIIAHLVEFYQKGNDRAGLQKDLQVSFDSLKQEHPALKELNIFMDAILGQLLTNLVKDPKPDDEEKFTALIELIKDNVAIIQSLSTLKEWKIDKNDLYTIQVENLF